MKNMKILVIGIISIFFLSGMLGAIAGGNNGEPGGLTPGFWKNLRKHQIHWVYYEPEDEIGDIFELPQELSSLEEVSLIEALKFGGGPGAMGMARNLLRQAVAALLNFMNPEIEYQYQGNIIDAVNNALDSLDRDTMEMLKDDLDEANNYGFEF